MSGCLHIRSSTTYKAFQPKDTQIADAALATDGSLRTIDQVTTSFSTHRNLAWLGALTMHRIFQWRNRARGNDSIDQAISDSGSIQFLRV